METLKIVKSRRVVREGKNWYAELLVPEEEFNNVKNILCYGILRRWPEASKTKFKLEGYRLFSKRSFPYAVPTPNESIVVQKMKNLNRFTKTDIDSMEIGAGYDVWELEDEKGELWHLYVAIPDIQSEFRFTSTRNHDEWYIPDGDFINWKTKRDAGK